MPRIWTIRYGTATLSERVAEHKPLDTHRDTTPRTLSDDQAYLRGRLAPQGVLLSDSWTTRCVFN